MSSFNIVDVNYSPLAAFWLQQALSDERRKTTKDESKGHQILLPDYELKSIHLLMKEGSFENLDDTKYWFKKSMMTKFPLLTPKGQENFHLGFDQTPALKIHPDSVKEIPLNHCFDCLEDHPPSDCSLKIEMWCPNCKWSFIGNRCPNCNYKK